MKKIPVGILGATGTVGQRLALLLADHPWFEVTALAASGRSAGARYADACHWLLPAAMPASVRRLVIAPLEAVPACRLVFSALPADVAGPLEERLAAEGCAVCSNASAHRLDPNVPLLVPEVNAGHADLIGEQRRRRGGRGFIAANPNCSAAPLSLVLKPLSEAFGLRRVSVVTMQAVSGAGYPGVPAPDILDNIIPHIAGEEEKVEREPRKLLGTLREGRVEEAQFILSAQCNRVGVRDGHTGCVSLEFERRPRVEEVVAALEAFRAGPDASGLPSSPPRPVVVRREDDRPQPLRDRDEGGGMAVVVGRVRPCPAFHVKLVLLGHNTVRGAAGGTVHIGELLLARGWLA
ncbi:MAG: aspartate-semialdehyde dehydrogenase [Candidatus Aminicenantes bacterium]|nr:aspartate-semialdehyde dehydrogenase [Candidatus Aminicenantes bacterium]